MINKSLFLILHLTFFILHSSFFIFPSLAQSVYTYSISSYGITGGALTVTEEGDPNGALTRTVHVKSHGVASTFYDVDTTLQCVQEMTTRGHLHTVTKKVKEKDFAQNDVLSLCFTGTNGLGMWMNVAKGTTNHFDISSNALDMVCFFFDLRERIAISEGAELPLGTIKEVDDHLIMDGTSHALSITAGKARKEKTSFGRIEVVPLELISKSPTLFVRNKPKNIRVSTHTPTVLSVDVGYSLGTAHATLESWTTNGIPVDLKETFK